MSTIIGTTLNADTIRKTGGSLGTDIRIKNTSVYESDGGTSVTQNLVQGLAKQWFNQSSGATPRDSFNVSGITDNQTGDDTYSYTNNMNDANHAVVPAGWRDHDHYHAANENMVSTSSSRVRAYNRGGNSTVDSGFKCCAVFGDLA